MLALLTRAFGWNIGKVVPSQTETAELSAAGITDPVMQKYAAWRKSALAFAAIWTAIAFVLGVLDIIDEGFHELTRVGMALEIAWCGVALALAGACVIGAANWKHPGSGFKLLLAAWAAGFLFPFFYALLPVSLVYSINTEPPVEGAVAAKVWAMGQVLIGFLMSAGGYLMLLPAILSLIPGIINGCLRVKSLVPAAQLPGWFLVCVAPLFLLFWIIILVFVNNLASSWLIVGGILLWAGSPIWYSIRSHVFIQSQIGETEAAKIGAVKKLAGLTALVGIGLLAAYALNAKIGSLSIFGFDREHAISVKIEELSEADNDVSLKDVQDAFEDSKSIVYALDLSNWRMVVDFLSKSLVVTVLFADVILRATVLAWRNDRNFRGEVGAVPFDATMGQAEKVLA